jgi:cysteine desulfurase
MTANNEVGSLSPLAGIGDVCRSRGALLHSDAVQALGKIPLNVGSLHVDLMSLSAHKIHGPKGVGALYIRQGIPVDAVSKGGGQERGKRPGTESVPLAVGFARAVEIAVDEMTEVSGRLASLRDRLETMIRSEFPGVIVNGHPSERLPNILSISFDSQRVSIEGELLVVNMDLEGVAVASGSACTSGSIQPSHVITAMGRDRATARATIRFSLGKGNTVDDIECALDALRKVISRMKQD